MLKGEDQQGNPKLIVPVGGMNPTVWQIRRTLLPVSSRRLVQRPVVRLCPDGVPRVIHNPLPTSWGRESYTFTGQEGFVAAAIS
jgi:hypothetical protein